MNRQKLINIFIWIFFILAIVQFPIITFIGSLRSAAFDIHFYEAEFNKYNPDVENRMEITEDLLFYLKEPKANKDYIRPFTISEGKHLVEVKVLMHTFFKIFYISIILLIASLLILLLLDKRVIKKVGLALVSGGLLTALLSFIFSKIIMIDFTAAFNKFHHIFFRLGNWQFPPDYMLVTLFPAQFWVDIIYKIIRSVVNTMVILVVLGALVLILYYYLESKEVKFLKSKEGILFKIKNIWK
jgi:integral membrane protein (TIGR01906 family)